MIAITTRLGSLSSYRYGIDAYDSTKLGLGPLIYQRAGSGENAYAGPAAIGLARPMEQSVAIPSAYPWAMQWQNDSTAEIDWVFLADISTASAVRRINAYTYDRKNSVFTWKGFVTLNFSTATNFTIRALRMTYDLESTGTVSVSSTGVTGTGTLFSTNRVCAGNRIGFGATLPSAINTWYEISSIANDTSLTLTTGATAISNTSYVIEDLRAILLTTNATTTNGGLYVVKGLNMGAFSTGASGTMINAGATGTGATVDNIRATYWLADAATVTGTTGCGLALESRTGPTAQNIYVLESTSNPVIYKYNVRAPLSLTAGKDTLGFAFKTSQGGTVTGTISQANNSRLAVASHGPFSGTASIYFTTTTRVYGTPVSSIQNGSTTWLSSGSVMVEVPPGSANTFAASSLMNSIEYASIIDKFLIAVNSTTTPFRSYLTQFRTDSGQFDRVWGWDNRQIDQSAASSDLTPTATYTGAAYSVWSEGGMCYAATIGTTAILNRLYAIPLAADWEYTSMSNSALVLPALSVSNVSKFTGIYVNSSDVIGGKTDKNLGLSPEPFRVSYRTSGISDDSGNWTLVNYTGEISVAGASQIQLKIEFRTMGTSHVPSRIHSTCVLYEEYATDSHYQFSVNKSSAANKQFAWRFSTAFGSTVPALRILLYDAISGGLLVDDNTGSPTGTFERSTDGSIWSTWVNTDKANDTTYLRYTPSSLADNINVRPVLTLL
jgi:hypothetical protein